jgi:hypothetical protein
MNLRVAAFAMLLPGMGVTQTSVDLRTQTKNVDFSGAASTKPFKMGETLPASCSVGETFFRKNTSTTQGIFLCLPANNWRLVGLGQTVSGQSPVNGDVLRWNASAGYWEPAQSLQAIGGQGIAIAGTTVAVEDAVIPAYYTGPGVPVLNCTTGRDFYVDNLNRDAYFCAMTNTWVLLSKEGHSHGWTDLAGEPLNVRQGGTGADLSVTGPGFLRQTDAGAAVTSTLLNEADLPVSVAKTTDFYANPAWITSLSAEKVSGVLGIGAGGTGQQNAAAAFQALSPTAAKGDLIGHNGTGNVRIEAGPDGSCLMTDSATPAGMKWTGCGGGGAAPNAPFITLAASPDLTLERVLTAGTWMSQADTGAGGAVTYSLQPDPRKYFFVHDECIGGGTSLTAGTLCELGWTMGGGGTSARLPGEAHHPGILRRDSSATLNTTAGLMLNTAAGANGPLANLNTAVWSISFGARFNHTTQVTGRIGLSNNVLTETAPDGIFFQSISGTTAENWACVTKTGGATQTNDTGVALDTAWHTFELRSNGARVDFLIDGTPRCTNTNSLSAAALIPFAFLKNTEAAAKSMDFDFFHLQMAVNR